MDLGDWLRSLGLSEYESAFRDNQIDGEVLPKLTGDDLKELGVTSVGHRRKLLSAIAELSGTFAEPAAVAKATRLDPPVHAVAERRQLTVMFCDLVGSTAMSARLDPEDMRETIAAYHQCCASLIERGGGFVAKYMGDGVLGYFGYPQAHEHDAERAVRAGLAIVEAAPTLQTAAGAPLHVRVGIATGIVIVGDLLGSGEALEREVVGATPNLAARLQGIAEPDSVVIAEGTRKLLGELFELIDLGPQKLKGVAGITPAFAALRESSQANRFDALHPDGLAALVGREAECELLLRRWAKAKGGEGQVVLISGEAGIGKSRLTAALLECLAGEPHTKLRYFCSPQHTDSAFYPIIDHIERAANFARDDDAKTRLDKLEAVLSKSSMSNEDAALLARMLSLPNDGRYPALDLAPHQRRQRTLAALARRIEGIARETPVLMVYEDAHWADPSSLEAIGLLVDKIEALRLLLFVTFRPEFVPPWDSGRPHVTTLAINRLAPREVTALIDRVAGDKSLAANIRQDIIERADGIPLFVEEMTKAVLEAESEGAAARVVASAPSPALAVPSSLHASLMARLDRLGQAKGVAQIGAAIGREFSHALLLSVADETEPELAVSLDRLLQSGLLSREGTPPHTMYLFKHALVQDAAYGTLLRESRRALHARIAEAIEERFSEVAESHPETLARHCTEAGQIEKAASLWGKAGQRSLGNAAFPEAERQLTRALAQITSLPSAAVVRREQIKLQVGLSYALMQTKGYGAPETKAAFELARVLIQRAEALGEPAEDPLALFSILYGVWVWNFAAFNSCATLELASQFLTLAGEQDETLPLAIGHRITASSLLVAGHIAKAREHFDRASALYNPDKHRPLAARIGHDLGVMTLCHRGIDLWLLGYPEAARADVDRALRDAREFKHAATMMYALTYNSIVNALRRDIADAQPDELLALADEKGAVFWKASGALVKSWLFVLTGRASEAATSFSSAIAMSRSTGATIFVPLFLSLLGSAFAKLRQFEQARRCIGEAMALAEASGEQWFDAEIYRIAGEIELGSSERKSPNAQCYFEQALGVARAQQTRSLELRAATGLARLWRGQGRRAEAHDLLARVYDWFTEGFETLDLKEAKALLEELASPVTH
jgi:class 3 adenylate cyclase/predicted ATPase